MDLDEIVRETFEKVIGVTPRDNDSIQTVEEWDSLSHVTLMLELEDRFHFTISDWLAVEMTDIPRIREVLQSVLASRRTSS
jgi:acyl carrier protein